MVNLALTANGELGNGHKAADADDKGFKCCLTKLEL